MGSWKSIMEMEESLTMEELYLLADASYRAEVRHNKFAAAIQGIDMDDNDDDAFDKIKSKAEAALSGRTEEEFVFDMIGIEVEDDDD